jgi:tRNA(Phe) wybutosine-synthesizing methylase Tyw3
MHLSVMEATKSHEIGELSLAALGPVLHVMAIDIAGKAASGEPAAAIA